MYPNIADSDKKKMDERRLRDALGQFVTGVTVIATRDTDGQFVGLTVSSFTSVSLDPPLVLWNLRRSSRVYDAFRAAEHFVVSILSAHQMSIAKQFSASVADRFSGVHWRKSRLAKLPIIDAAAAWFECKNLTHYEGGDHSIFIGEVSDFECRNCRPLLYHAGSYVVPAHRAERQNSHVSDETNISLGDPDGLFGDIGCGMNI